MGPLLVTLATFEKVEVTEADLVMFPSLQAREAPAALTAQLRMSEVTTASEAAFY